MSLSHHVRASHPSVVGVNVQPATEEKEQVLPSFAVGPQHPCNDSRQEKIMQLLNNNPQ